MAEILCCSKSDIKKYYSFQQSQGAEEVTVNLATKLYELAMGGNVTALTFWLKTKAGWKDAVEGEGKDSGIQKTISAMSSVDKTQRILHLLKGKSKK
jgi:hypothetical protein